MEFDQEAIDKLYDSVERLYREFGLTHPDGKAAYKKWYDQHQERNPSDSGYSQSNIYRIKTDLSEFDLEAYILERNKKGLNKNKLKNKEPNCISKANAFIKYSDHYTIYLEGRKQSRKNVWLAYFYYPGTGKNKKPSIGKAVVETSHPDLVKITNINWDGFSKNYEGKLRHVISSSVLEFTLYPTESVREDTVQTNMKFSCKNLEHDILLGTYIMQQTSYLIIGKIVLVNKSQVREASYHEKPDLLSYSQNAVEFTDLPPVLKKYLSFKRQNYIRIPLERNTLDLLGSYMNEFEEAKFNEFVDLVKPLIMVSAPESTPKKDFSEFSSWLKKYAEEDFTCFNTDGGDKKVLEKIGASNLLTALKRARFAVFILGRGMDSFQQICEMGMAIPFCKKIYVLYPFGGPPTNPLTQFKQYNVEFIDYRDLEDEAKSLSYSIIEGLRRDFLN